MRAAISSMFKTTYTLKRKTGRDADLNATLSTVGTFKGRKEDRSRIFFKDDQIDSPQGSISVFCINDLNAVEGDIVEFPDAEERTITRVNQVPDNNGIKYAELIF